MFAPSSELRGHMPKQPISTWLARRAPIKQRHSDGQATNATATAMWNRIEASTKGVGTQRRPRSGRYGSISVLLPAVVGMPFSVTGRPHATPRIRLEPEDHHDQGPE